jgi:hypothetical protein
MDGSACTTDGTREETLYSILENILLAGRSESIIDTPGLRKVARY